MSLENADERRCRRSEILVETRTGRCATGSDSRNPLRNPISPYRQHTLRDHRADLKVANNCLLELNYNMTKCSFLFIATKNEFFVWRGGRPNAIHSRKQSTALGGSKAMQQFALLRCCSYPECDVIKWN